MSGPSVLLDINILISGLVFSGGNEHSILRRARVSGYTIGRLW